MQRKKSVRSAAADKDSAFCVLLANTIGDKGVSLNTFRCIYMRLTWENKMNDITMCRVLSAKPASHRGCVESMSKHIESA